MARLSELKPGQARIVESSEPAPQQRAGGTLRLSDIDPGKVKTVVPVEEMPTSEEIGPLERFSRKGLEVMDTAGRAWDSVTGAPTRAAINAVQRGNGLFGAVKAFGQQFGEKPELAPQGSEIAEAAGFSKEEFETPFRGIDNRPLKTTPAKVAGVGVDVLADWTNLIPVGAVAKGGFRASKAAGKTAVDLSGKAATKVLPAPVVDVAKDSAKGVKFALDKLFKPKVADDFAEMSDIASKHGIDPGSLPESIEFGDSSLISRATRHKREGILGEQSLDKFNDGLRQVRDATDNTIAKIGGGFVPSPIEAGNIIRNSYDQAVDKFFDSVDTSYNSVIKDYPGLKITDTRIGGKASPADKLASALSGVEKFAVGRVKRGVTAVQEEQGKRLLNAVNAIRSTNGSVKQAVEALRDIGDAAFKSQNTLAAIPADIQKMRHLYGEISEAVMETIRTSVADGEAVAGALKANNAKMHEFFGHKSILEPLIGNKNMAPENLYRSLVLNGDSRKIEALRQILPPETMGQLKAATLNGLIKRTDDLDFNFRQVRNAIQNKQTILTSLLTPDEAAEFVDVVRLGDRFGTPVLSTSGTGASNVFRDIRGNLQDSIFNDAFIETMKRRARNPDGTTGVAPMISDDLLSGVPDGSMTETLKLPPRSILERGAKAAQIKSTLPTEEKDLRVEAIRRRMNRARRMAE